MRYCRDIFVKNVIVGTPFFTSIFFANFVPATTFCTIFLIYIVQAMNNMWELDILDLYICLSKNF